LQLTFVVVYICGNFDRFFILAKNFMSLVQRTLVVLKPDTVGRSVIGEIISRFERAGLHLVAMKMVKPTKEFLHQHYE